MPIHSNMNVLYARAVQQTSTHNINMHHHTRMGLALPTGKNGKIKNPIKTAQKKTALKKVMYKSVQHPLFSKNDAGRPCIVACSFL